MEPGRELDTLIAEKVMGISLKSKCYMCDNGWQGLDPCCACNWQSDGKKPTRGWKITMPDYYSTDIADAWEVVKKIKSNQVLGVINICGPTDDCEHWRACFTKKWIATEDEWTAFQMGETMPHAICLAALKSVGAL